MKNSISKQITFIYLSLSFSILKFAFNFKKVHVCSIYVRISAYVSKSCMTHNLRPVRNIEL